MDVTLGLFPVRLAGYSFHFVAPGGLYWPAEKALLIADLHLGKDATFRAAGIGVPRGSTRATLGSVSRMIEATLPETLYILGDLCHARSSLSAETKACFEQFRDRHASIDMVLSDGNHDRSVGRLPEQWGLRRVGGSHRVAGVGLTHVPSGCPSDCDLLVAGHVHPAHALTHAGETTGKLPCFWYRDRCLILPACGHFTGTAKIDAGSSDQIWLVAEDRIVELG